jgi:hypothetical protein
MASKATIKEIRDMSDYQYKFYTNLDAVDLNAGKEMFKNPSIY